MAYVKPFDLLVEGNETGNWLGVRDDFPQLAHPCGVILTALQQQPPADLLISITPGVRRLVDVR